ncbi:MAG TPA: acyl carrier protein [Acidimicrobiia bacterium]|jgi:acyl carrier protein|nr:acyl carrier protein [Acidimicrobiia bacterium]
MNTADVVRTFVFDELNFRGSKNQLTDDYPLLENEVVDSMGLFHLVGLLEKTFDVEIPDEDLIPEHFGTIRGIAALIRSKLGDVPGTEI